MNNSEIKKDEISLQAIAKSLDFITKSLGNFATKKDLEIFATKKDLERFATKEDFSRLEDLIDSLAITTAKEIQGVYIKIDELEQKVDRNHKYSVNQLDNIMLHYARREEYNYYGERLTKLERKVFS